jgi:H+/Cl- antiporter ClcA/CBS domain-containing protein
LSNVSGGLGDFTTDRSVLIHSILAILIGALSAFVAKVLLWLIALFTNIAFLGRFSAGTGGPEQSHLGPWIIAIPVVGGLVIGFMARYGSEKIRGHGIPEALEAILIGRSKMEAKVAVLKPLSSAISIGTGGPFGAEGPIIMTGGALGSLCAQFFHLSSAERKTLLVAGAAGGMSAVFGTPVAAVLLAVELLLFEWKPRSFIPVAFASATAAVLRGPLLGTGPIFPVTPHASFTAAGIGCALLVGVLAGFGSGLLTSLVYGFEDLFPKLKVHWMWWPAIGGLFVGIGGFIDPRVLGVGYDLIASLLNGQILGAALIGLLIGKAVVWCIALGSGTSGGVLAPLLIMGGALGALVGQVLPVGSPGLWALLGMAAMMGGTMRAPLTAMVFALELTHDMNILPGLLVACIASQAVTVLLMKRSILTEKVARRGLHLIREYVVDPFDVHRVREVMVANPPTVPKSMLVSEFSELSARDRWFLRRAAMLIAEEDGSLAGIITQSDLLKAQEDNVEDITVLECGTANLVVAHEDELLREAVVKLLSNGIGRLPVVSAGDNRQIIGYIDRGSLMKARMRWYEEEHRRERHLSLKNAQA